MTFRHLEEIIVKEGREADYLSIADGLKEPTRSTYSYLLDIASVLRQNSLQDQYQVFGGYAVLAHLIKQYGDRIVLAWRGSQDIDMIGNMQVLTALKGFYQVKSDLPSPNIPSKRTVKLSTDNEEECKIDYTTGQKRGRTEVVPILGIEVPVLEPSELIKSKLYAKDELVHKVDIVKMLGILEVRKYDPEEFAQSLTPEQRLDIYDVVLTGHDMTRNARMTMGPSKEYMSKLKDYLRRLK
ncbi:MAG: hypothetical protein AABY07_07370 [Nanoarchaeota archaeon]